MLTLPVISSILFVASIVITYFLVDRIREVMIYKQISDQPNERSSHQVATPNLGGMAFYIVLMLSFYFIQGYEDNSSLISFLPGLTILFIVGLKDDLVVLAPLTKLLAQTAAAVFLVFQYRYSIESLHGFMGIQDMPAWLAAPLAVIIIVAVINAVNLIDGIDGLAATISIIMFSVFGGIFYFAGKVYLMLIAIVMIGALIAFLRFNLSKEKKIFMGDTGSMILGFLIGAMTVRFLSLDTTAIQKLPFYFENIPFVVAAILIVPFFDTARVFTLRILQKKSPFSPDRSHIHHIIIDKFGISHRRASFFIGVVHFIFVVIFSALAMFTTQWLLLALFAIAILAAVVFFFFLHNPRSLRKMRINAKRRLKSLNIF
jgi:UDP-GlcNAc:undecaprenyl-phosphate/decaprenyl-phosphate GlcNAc-1-phosphate transferase